jgi:hypothetical protein
MNVDGTSFLHHIANEAFCVGMTRKSASAGAIFEFLNGLPDVIRAGLQIKDSLISNLVILNAVDIGYPQNTDAESIRVLTSGSWRRLRWGPWSHGWQSWRLASFHGDAGHPLFAEQHLRRCG